MSPKQFTKVQKKKKSKGTSNMFLGKPNPYKEPISTSLKATILCKMKKTKQNTA